MVSNFPVALTGVPCHCIFGLPPPQDPQKRPTIGQVLHQPFMVAARDQTATSARPVPAGGLEVYVPKGVCPGVGDGGGGRCSTAAHIMEWAEPSFCRRGICEVHILYFEHISHIWHIFRQKVHIFAHIWLIFRGFSGFSHCIF